MLALFAENIEKDLLRNNHQLHHRTCRHASETNNIRRRRRKPYCTMPFHSSTHVVHAESASNNGQRDNWKWKIHGESEWVFCAAALFLPDFLINSSFYYSFLDQSVNGNWNEPDSRVQERKRDWYPSFWAKWWSQAQQNLIISKHMNELKLWREKSIIIVPFGWHTVPHAHDAQWHTLKVSTSILCLDIWVERWMTIIDVQLLWRLHGYMTSDKH